eukprot:332206-Pyramimonas_sp.AAC.1
MKHLTLDCWIIGDSATRWMTFGPPPPTRSKCGPPTTKLQRRLQRGQRTWVATLREWEAEVRTIVLNIIVHCIVLGSDIERVGGG